MHFRGALLAWPPLSSIGSVPALNLKWVLTPLVYTVIQYLMAGKVHREVPGWRGGATGSFSVNSPASTWMCGLWFVLLLVNSWPWLWTARRRASWREQRWWPTPPTCPSLPERLPSTQVKATPPAKATPQAPRYCLHDTFTFFLITQVVSTPFFYKDI